MQIGEKKLLKAERFLPKVQRRADTLEAVGWGLMPLLSLTSAVGLLLVVLAYSFSRGGSAQSTIVYWLGMLTIFVPIAARLIMVDVSRKERITLVVFLGMMLFLAKALYSPSQLRFHDELQQMRSAVEIMDAGRLFQPNPMLPVSPSYPGLQNMAVGLAQLSGLSLFHSSVMVNVAARLVVVLATYLFYEFISQSPRVASVAAILYMTNPHFIFFSAMFAYQSLALPLALLLLYLALREDTKRSTPGLQIVAALGLLAVTVTHHVTSYMLLLFLVLWYVLRMTLRRKERVPLWMIVALAGMIVVWVIYFAPITIDYLAPQITRALEGLTGFFNPSATERVRPPGNPLIEQLFTYGAALVLAASLPFGLWVIWKRQYNHTAVLVMAVASLAYYGTLALRLLSAQGVEVAGRSMPFVYFAAVFVMAIFIDGVWKPQDVSLPTRRNLKWLFAWLLNRIMNLPLEVKFLGAVALATIMFVGGITAGWPPHYARLPGPYLVTAYERSIDPQGVEAARWTDEALGRNNRIAVDFTHYALMGMYGRQYPVFGVPRVYFSPRIGPREEQDLRLAAIRYLVVDNRLSTGLPLRGTYFVPWEPDANNHTIPIDAAALAKFDDVPEIDRLFDSGDIVIYDVRALSRVQ